MKTGRKKKRKKQIKENKLKKSGDDSGKDTPVPIPNTEVKLPYAENTWWATAREHR